MEISEIKRYFFAHRNGVTADVMKRGGSAFTIIFGVDVPALSALAKSIGFDKGLAMALWGDENVRESHLLAPWLLDPEELTQEEALQLCTGVRDMEDSMMLAFRVLKRRGDAEQILNFLEHSPIRSHLLAADALRRHLQ